MIPKPRNSDRAPTQRIIAIALLVVTAITIALLTLTPEPGSNTNSFWCLKCGGHPGVDVLLNILLFVPVGVGLGLYGLKLGRAALIALACTCLIETLQFVVPGRDPSVRDIITNFTGGLFGYLLGSGWRSLILPRPSVARNIAAMVTVLWVITQLLTAWAMQAAPPPAPWWAQLRPERDNYRAYFKDTLVAMSIDSVRFRYPDELDDSIAESLRNKMRGGTPFRVSITDVDTTRPLAAVGIISAGPVHDVVWWAVDKRDAVYGATVRGTLLGLRTPTVRIKDVVPESRTDTLELTGLYRHGWYELQALNATGYRHRELRASASWGWAFVLPFPLYAFGSEVIWLTALYLAGVWFVLGYWNARSSVSSRAIVPVLGMALGIFLGLGIAPLVFALPVAHWSEWLAALAGGSAGWIIGTMIKNTGQQFTSSSPHAAQSDAIAS